MTWLTCRQTRTQLTGGAVVLLILAALLAVTGPHLAHDAADPSGFLARTYTERIYPTLYIAGIVLLYAAPPLFGAFWGAPMVTREIEAGTHRLVLNQSISRNRWLAAKLGLTVLAGAVLTGLLSLAVSWWANPIDRAAGHGDSGGALHFPRIYPLIFGVRGIVPIGYTVFAIVLGVAIGLLLRRTVPAIALTLLLVSAAMLATPLFVRPHLVAPVTTTSAITWEKLGGLMIAGDPSRGPTGPVHNLTLQIDQPDAWLLVNRPIDRNGTAPDTLPSWVGLCVPKDATGVTPDAQSTACFARLAAEGYRQRISYLPGRRFWALQSRETGLALAVAALLTGFCFARIRRDVT